MGLVILEVVGNFARVSDAPPAALQIALLHQVALRSEKQRQLQRLAGQPGQVGELQECHTLGVFVLFLPIHDPVGRIPDGDGVESLSTWIKRIRPSFEADRRLDRNPAQTAIGNPAARLADVLADGKIEIMPWHGQLFATDPELQQSRIDIDQRRPAEACQQPRADGIVEIQQQVCPLKDGFGLVAGHVDVLRRRFGRGFVAAHEVKEDVPVQPKLFHPGAERGQRGSFFFRVARGAEAFEPVNLASQLPQAERVLQVHPEVPAAFGVIDDVEGCDDNGGHVAKRTNFE